MLGLLGTPIQLPPTPLPLHGAKMFGVCRCRGLHLTIVGTGSVEQFFSFCKYTDTDQRHAIRDNARRVAFMAHDNGEVEGRLD